MNIALLTYNDDNYSSLKDLTLPTKQKYCDKWGFKLEHINSNGRNPNWFKPDIFLQTLHNYDAVLYVECDAAIINQDFDIRPFISTHEFAIASDWCGINSGIFMAQNTNLTKQFFYTIFTEGPIWWPHHRGKEQEAMRYFVGTPPYKNMTTVVEQNFMNSYVNELYGWPNFVQGNYQEGDWIVHLQGQSNEKRCEVFREKFGL